jgi:SNF2 family DNA or RNA helicase
MVRADGNCEVSAAAGLRCVEEADYLEGMKTSLKNHQLIGSSFLRGREISKNPPRGGMLSDEMGFGKTVMMSRLSSFAALRISCY